MTLLDRAAWIEVADARAALAEAAAAVHGHPSERLKLVGITGTNGKTTTAHLIDSIIRVAEGTSAMFGTINHRIGDRAETARHTTPEAADIQRMLAEAVRRGVSLGGDGNIFARNRASPRAWAEAGRGRLHEFDARPSRLSQDDGELLRRKKEAV